jgi:hypothetical protein
MKSKFFTLFAAFVLLFSAQASAQVNGDVNGDGKVNEQDIASILEIMAEAGGVKEQPKYYWYVGFDNEDWYTNRNLVTTAKLQSTTTNSFPTTWSKSSGNKYTVPGTKGAYYVVIVPNDWDYPTLHNPAGGTVGLTDKTTITIDGKTYKIGWSAAEMQLTEIFIN